MVWSKECGVVLAPEVLMARSGCNLAPWSPSPCSAMVLARTSFNSPESNEDIDGLGYKASWARSARVLSTGGSWLDPPVLDLLDQERI